MFCQLMTLVLVGGLIFFLLLGTIYMPFVEAVQKRTESKEQAEIYTAKVCNNTEILSSLGRIGQRDCAEYARILKMDVEKEASLDVLRKLNLCKDGECLIMSFSLVTFVTTFLPMVLITFVVLLIVLIGRILYNGYVAMQANDELPMKYASALASQLLASAKPNPNYYPNPDYGDHEHNKHTKYQ